MFKINFLCCGLLKIGVVVGVGFVLFIYLLVVGYSGFINVLIGGIVIFGFNVFQIGLYVDEGVDELCVYEFVVEYLNGEGDGGMMNIFLLKVLQGNGIFGKKVEYVIGDIQIKLDVVCVLVKLMIEKDGVIMIIGGLLLGVVVVVQVLCQEVGVIFMVGLIYLNDIIGKDKCVNGFCYFFNLYMLGVVLVLVLVNVYGIDCNVYYLIVDYNWGYIIEEVVCLLIEVMGWNIVVIVKMLLIQIDFLLYIVFVFQLGVDILVLNYYGGNMVNLLISVVQFGLCDFVVDNKDFQIVVLLYLCLMVCGVGENVKGIFGLINWYWLLQDEGLCVFVQLFGIKYGFLLLQVVYICYVQILLYVDVVECVGLFVFCVVVEVFEGYEFDGLGNGKILYCVDDYQCFKDVLVVKGKENLILEFDFFEIVEVIFVDQVIYVLDYLQFQGGVLGSCNNGV